MTDISAMWGEKSQEDYAAEARGEFKILPAGWYSVVIEKCYLKDTASGGKMIVVEFDNGTVARLNVKNASAEAERIGKSQFAKMALVSGVPTCTDTDQLVGMRLDISVTVGEFRSNTTGKMLQSNSVGDYEKLGAKAGRKPEPATNPAGETVPW